MNTQYLKNANTPLLPIATTDKVNEWWDYFLSVYFVGIDMSFIVMTALALGTSAKSVAKKSMYIF
jgi:heme/copper-type cytochrome/quinol oxidase subunit 2